MRTILLILLFFLAASGCLEERLSPSEAQMCLLSTQTQPSLIPACKTTAECENELTKFFPEKTYRHTPVGLEHIRVRKGLAGAWNSIQRASLALEQINQSCTTMKAGDLLSRAVVSASELQNVLKKTEESQEFTYRALEKSIAYGKTLELEKIKDTKTFEAYVKLLQNGFELQTQNPTSEWALKQSENQTYFENVARVLAQNKAGTYRVEWSNVFDAYRTGVVIAAPENMRVLLAVSPIWQGALGAFLGKQSNVNALGIVTQINANDMVVHAEQIAAPENGLVIQTWKNIQAFDDEVVALYDMEQKMETDASQIIAENLVQAEESKSTNQKWIEVATSMTELAKTNESPPRSGEFWQALSDWETLREENKVLRENRVNETKPIGARIRERRELSRKIGDAEVKMVENEEMVEFLREQCRIFLKKNNTEVELDVENCLNGINEVKQQILEKISPEKSGLWAELNACVQSLNEIEKALGEEESTPEIFENNFGSGSVNACESARLNRINEYGHLPAVIEWNEKKEIIESFSKGIARASIGWDWNEEHIAHDRMERAQKLIRNQKPMAENALREAIVKMTESIAELEDSLNQISQEAGRHIRWKIITPQVIHADKEEPFEAEGIIENGWGNEIEFSFEIAADNPGLDTISVETEGISAEVLDTQLRIWGPYLPPEKIAVKGEGNGILAKINGEKTHVKMTGAKAAVTTIMEIQTKMTPTRVYVSKSFPNGVKENSVSVWTDEKRLILNQGIENGFEIDTKKERTNVSFTYELENAVVTETHIKNFTNEWGRVRTTYEITANNAIPQEIQATIFTGVSGDPLLTESLRVTNENAEQVPYTLDAVGNVVISNQTIGANDRIRFIILAERNEAIEEWFGLLERLGLDISTLQNAESSEVKRDALKLKNKLNALRDEKDSARLADKLIEIQTEVSLLWLREEAYQNEWSALESEWKVVATDVNSEMKKWIVEGTSALENRNKQKLLEAIQKITESQKLRNEITDMAEGDEDNKMEMSKAAVAQALANAVAYEKALSIGCEKLLQINFTCPLDEDEFRNMVRQLNSDKKIIEKLETKWNKLNAAGQASEWKISEKEWVRAETEANKMNKTIEDSLRALRNAAIERTAALKNETRGNTSEDIISSVEKATSSADSGEFGKSIFVAQSVLNYLNGNKTTGLVSLPILAWPFIGIIVLMGGIVVWKERVKNKDAIIPVKTIPRIKTFTPTEKNISASGHPPMPEERQLGEIGREEQYIRARPVMLAHSEKVMPRRVKNLKTRPRKEEPHSPRVE